MSASMFVSASDLLAKLVTESCRSETPLHIMRRRSLTSLDVALFILGLATSRRKEGYASVASRVWRSRSARPPAASSLCAARRRFDERFFSSLHHQFLESTAPRAPCPRWLGRRLFAVDATKLRAARELSSRGEAKDVGGFYPQLMLSLCFRPLDGQVESFELSFTFDERLHATSHLAGLRSRDVVVYDRGYPSYELVFEHGVRGIDFVFRLQKSTFRGVSAFVKSQDREAVLILLPGEDCRARLRRRFGERALTTRLRVVKARVGRKTFVLATSLFGAVFSRRRLIDVYRRRWAVEEGIKKLKRTMGLDPLHAKTLAGARQEVSAEILVHAVTTFLCRLAARPRGGGSINFKFAFLSLARELVTILAGPARARRESAAAVYFATSRQRRRPRPGRSYERVSHEPCGAWRPFSKPCAAGRRAKHRASQAATRPGSPL